MQNRGYVFIDIDGTINMFKSVDFCIINSIFGKYFHIMFLDKILWKINDLDFFSNTMIIFKIRIFLYSILSFSAFGKNLKEYQRLYYEYTLEDIEKNYVHLDKLRKIGYKVYLLTHNEFTRNFKDLTIEISKNKQNYIFDFSQKNKILYMIGNNYMEDLRIPIKLGIKTIYIGKSKLVMALIANKASTFYDIEEAVNHILGMTK